MTKTTSTTPKVLTDATTPEQILDWLLAEIAEEAARLQSEWDKANRDETGMEEYFCGKLAGTTYIGQQAKNARRWMDFCKVYDLADTQAK